MLSQHHTHTYSRPITPLTSDQHSSSMSSDNSPFEVQMPSYHTLNRGPDAPRSANCYYHSFVRCGTASPGHVAIPRVELAGTVFNANNANHWPPTAAQTTARDLPRFVQATRSFHKNALHKWPEYGGHAGKYQVAASQAKARTAKRQCIRAEQVAAPGAS